MEKESLFAHSFASAFSSIVSEDYCDLDIEMDTDTLKGMIKLQDYYRLLDGKIKKTYPINKNLPRGIIRKVKIISIKDWPKTFRLLKLLSVSELDLTRTHFFRTHDRAWDIICNYLSDNIQILHLPNSRTIEKTEKIIRYSRRKKRVVYIHEADNSVKIYTLDNQYKLQQILETDVPSALEE